MNRKALNVRSRLASYESYDLDRDLEAIRREKMRVARELAIRNRNIKRMEKKRAGSTSSSSSSDDEKQELTEEQKTKLSLLLKASVKEFCEMTSAHGFLNISKSTSWIVRIAWILLVIVSISYCIYSMCSTLFQFRFWILFFVILIFF